MKISTKLDKQLKKAVEKKVKILEKDLKDIINIVKGQNIKPYILRDLFNLTLKDKEYINKLEKENNELKEKLEAIKNTIGQTL